MSEPGPADNRSTLKDFVSSIAAIRGDLSNITAPPFVLDTKSTVELPSFWGERPSIFVAPASSQDPAERALLVLRWFLASLRNQQYAGRAPGQGIKKPLNAFLGELFLARWEDEAGLTRLVCEQVSHHPPVTACRLWNEEYGVSAEGYTRQEITFSGSINIQQTGHAIVHLSRHNESYLIPLPDVKIKSILTGGPYPELEGTYHLPSTNGYMSTIEFGSKGLFSSSNKKHSFEAKVYHEGAEDSPLYTVTGNWDSVFVTRDVRRDIEIEKFDAETARTVPLETDPLEEQDPWETRRAWHEVRQALQRGDMQAAADAKSKLENGQRELHKTDEDGKTWQRLFFTTEPHDEVADGLAKKIGQALTPADTVAAWRFRLKEWQAGQFRKPYHGDLRPDSTRVGSSVGGGSVGQQQPTTNAPTSIAASAPAPAAGTRTQNTSGISMYSQVTASENETIELPPTWTGEANNGSTHVGTSREPEPVSTGTSHVQDETPVQDAFYADAPQAHVPIAVDTSRKEEILSTDTSDLQEYVRADTDQQQENLYEGTGQRQEALAANITERQGYVSEVPSQQPGPVPADDSQRRQHLSESTFQNREPVPANTYPGSEAPDTSRGQEPLSADTSRRQEPGPADVSQRQQPLSSGVIGQKDHAGTTGGRGPVDQGASQKQEPDLNEVDSGVAGMSVKEKSQVEDFLRKKYSSSGR